MHDGYSHLLGGAALGLDCASCLHIDDIGERVSVDELMAHALEFFEEIRETPKAVGYQFVAELKHHRSSVQKFRKGAVGMNHAVGTTFQSIMITSTGFEGNDISDTWTPRSVVSVALHGKILEAFVQSPHDFEQERMFLAELPSRMFKLPYSAAYIFPYPFVFSPLAYASGISYSPNIKRFGQLMDRDSDRVVNWANHCYRGHRASEGYLRDIYPMNIISPEYVMTSINGCDLTEWIKHHPNRGRLSHLHEKLLWTVDYKYLQSVQRDLDSAKVLLSGFAPDQRITGLR